MKGNKRIREPIIERNPPICKCRYTSESLSKLDGDLTKSFWSNAEWMDDFRDIEGDTRPAPWKKTRVKLLWNEEALYIGAQLEEDEIWATVTERDKLIFTDNDFEVFLAPQTTSHRYYELEMNANNAVWDLMMEKPQRDCVRRIISWDIKGLESAVKIDGVINDANIKSNGWSIELKLPWISFREAGIDQCEPAHISPDIGEIWRMNFSRVCWDVDRVNGQYVKRTGADGNPLSEHNWVWAPTGVIDIHMPEMWGYLIFTKTGEDYPLPPEDNTKWLLRKLYYREHKYCCEHGSFTSDVTLLLGDEGKNVKVYTTPSMFEGITEFDGKEWHIRQDGYVWCGDEA